MSTYDYASLARSIYDAYNARDFEKAISVVSNDCEWTNVPTGETFRGPEGFRKDISAWDAAFPDSKVEIKSVLAAGDHVVVEFIGRGTHTGPLTGPAGTISPTGRPVELHFCDVILCKDGKIVGGRSYFDLATMMRQLGLMPEQPTMPEWAPMEQPGATAAE